VFNILKTPILNSGIGLPHDNFGYYFVGIPDAPSDAPIAGWNAPIEVVSNDRAGRDYSGNALRIIYSLPAGVKNGVNAVTNFSAKTDSEINRTSSNIAITLTGNPPAGIDGIKGMVGEPKLDMRSLVTFPGAYMHPEYVLNDPAGNEIHVSGKTPFIVDTNGVGTSADAIARNMVLPFHDLHLVKAGVAYVDDNSRFYMHEVLDEDVSSLSLADRFPNAEERGFRVDGIKAIRFESETESRSIMVRLVAEGDAYDTVRKETEQAKSLISEWPGVNFDSAMYYEEFSLRFRTRNVSVP
jgi:hypothetical protein